MFNLSGSELVFLLLLALIVLGPEKLPDAIRRFGKTYAEIKKMTAGFQSELKQSLDEPMREMRETADAVRKAATIEGFDSIIDSAKAVARGGAIEAHPMDAAADAAADSPTDSATDSAVEEPAPSSTSDADPESPAS